MYDTMEARFQIREWFRDRMDGKSRNSYNTYGADRGTIIYGTTETVFVKSPGGYKQLRCGGKLIQRELWAEVRKRNSARRRRRYVEARCT